MNKFFVLAFFLTANHSFAETCSKLNECVDVASRLTNKTYLTNVDLSAKVYATDNLNITQTNADKIISALLNNQGLTRVGVDSDTYMIINARDIRYTQINTLDYGGNLEDIPDLSDYFLLSINIKNADAMPFMAPALRPFLSRYGRIVEQVSSSKILIQDTGVNLRKIVAIIDDLDVPVNVDNLNKYKKYGCVQDKKENEKTSKSSVNTKNKEVILQKLNTHPL